MPSELFQSEISQALYVPDASDVFVKSLRQKLLAQTPQPARSARPFWLRPAWIATLAVLIVLFVTTLLIGPQKVWAAFQGWFGYIPGLGVVQNGSELRLLAEPVSLQRDGITLTIENAAADPTRTILVYKTEGLSVAASNSQGEPAPTGGPAVLVLPDGSVLTSQHLSSDLWATGYRDRLEFPALPEDVSTAELFINRLDTMPEGAAPQGWRISFQLNPAPPDLKVMPVYQINTPTAAPVQTLSPAGEPATLNIIEESGIQFVLDQVIEIETGYQFQGRVLWKADADIIWVDPDPFSIQLTSAGVEIPVEPADVNGTYDPNHPNQAYWAVQTNTKSLPGPVQISLDWMSIYKRVDLPFQLDLGGAPEINQVWKPGLSFSYEGKSILLTTVQLFLNSKGNPNLNFYFKADPEVMVITVSDPNLIPPEIETAAGGGGGGGGGGWHNPNQPDPEATTFTNLVYGALPVGKRDLNINSIEIRVPSAQTVTWQPPAAVTSASTSPTPRPSACLNLAAWQTMLAQPAAGLPAGLGGTILLQRYIPGSGDLMPTLVLSSLDGTQSKIIDKGAWSALSPDGRYITYIRSDGPGLYLADLAANQISLIPNTQPEDYNPLWSPDSQWILFYRGSSEYEFYKIRPDGTELSLVYKTNLLTQFSRFLPDGQHVIAQSLQESGVVVQSVDIAAGTAVDLAQTGMRKTVADPLPSPDGEWLAYRDFEFGGSNYSLVLARMDGTEKKILADDSLLTTMGSWSKDGKWLLVTILKDADGNYLYQPVLIQVDTCQVIPLPNLDGEVKGWAE